VLTSKNYQVFLALKYQRQVCLLWMNLSISLSTSLGIFPEVTRPQTEALQIMCRDYEKSVSNQVNHLTKGYQDFINRLHRVHIFYGLSICPFQMISTGSACQMSVGQWAPRRGAAAACALSTNTCQSPFGCPNTS